LTKLSAAVFAPKLSWAFALVILLLVGAVGLLVMRTRRLQNELSATESERARQERSVRDLQEELAGQRARADQLTSDLNELHSQQDSTPNGPSQTGSLVATLMLTIGNERGGEIPPPARLVIAPQTTRVRLLLNLIDNDYQRYTILVQSANGQQVFKQEGVRSNDKRRASLAVTAPAAKFSDGDYILTLKAMTASGAVEDVGKRLFRVARK
jgi:septal ring factor EnvC (AmiA/AmiB activator)